MDLDVYRPCPCGSGKKIKFCCCGDILSDLDKVIRTFAAGQHVATLDQISRVTTAKGPRPALQVLKADIHLGMGDLKTAEETIRPLYETLPDNPTVMCYRGIFAVENGDSLRAFDLYQQILARVQDREQTPAAMGHLFAIMVNGLLEEGEYRTARALLLHRMIASRFHENAVGEFRQIEKRLDLPLLWRYPFELTAAEGTPNYPAIAAAVDLGYRGCWSAAEAALEQLQPKLTESEKLTVNRIAARLIGWLPGTARTVEVWRRYSRSPGIADEESVEAEATAQLFVSNREDAHVDELRVTIPVRDMERFQERCLSSRRLVSMPEPRSTEEGQPPPKAHFALLSRDRLPANEVPSWETAPIMVADLLLYGRQTDRDARVEVYLRRTRDYAAHLDTLTEVGGEFLADAASRQEEVVDTDSEFNALIEQQAWLESPDIDLLQELERQKCRQIVLERWPEISLGCLDGKAPRMVASDPAYRLKLQGALLNVELLAWTGRWPVQGNELRRKLGLPEVRLSAFGAGNFLSLPLSRLARLEMSVLPTEQIVDINQAAVLFHVSRTAYEAAAELLRRPAEMSTQRLPRYALLAQMAENAPDFKTALELTLDAQAEAEKSGGPLGILRVRELAIRLQRMEMNRVGELVQSISNRHGREPETMQLLLNLLNAYGLISRSEASRQVAATVPEPAPSSSIVLPGAAAAPAAGQKSKLILPGLD